MRCSLDRLSYRMSDEFLDTPMNTLKPHNDSDTEQDAVRERITYTHAVADWCLRQARRHMERGNIEAALLWNYQASRMLIRGCRPLVSETIERNLREIASLLPRVEWRPTRGREAPRRWLHVIDHALPYGGHTAMARRWITSDPGKSVHNVVLTVQEQPVPEALADAARRTGGEIFLPDPNSSFLSRAMWLRELAYANADCVVFHVGSDSVIAPTAFGVDGGPPVLLVNICAHTFWTGASVADLVLNSTGSKLERFWTRHYRGASSAATLPIPVQPPQNCAGDDVFTAEFRAQARQRLNLPTDAVVLLSVGREEKYRPVPGLNFFAVANSILEECPQARMLVVGPSAKSYQTKLNNRLAVVGCQLDLRIYYAAADIYMESFPFGSTTALLEAGVHGLPCVLTPEDCPPPFGTDGVAVEGVLQRPASVDEYAGRVKDLIASSEERIRCGTSFARSIRQHHCDAGWTQYLSDLIRQIPEVHTLHPVVQPPSPPEEYDYYWTRCNSRFRGDPLFVTFLGAISFGLKPTLDVPLSQACRAAKRGRRRQGLLQTTVPILLSALLPLCPAAAVGFLHRTLMYLWDLKRRLKSFLRRRDNVNPDSNEPVAAV